MLTKKKLYKEGRQCWPKKKLRGGGETILTQKKLYKERRQYWPKKTKKEGRQCWPKYIYKEGRQCWPKKNYISRGDNVDQKKTI